MKYIEKKKLIDYLIKFSLIPEIVYGWMQATILIYSYVLSFLNIKQKW